jgi:hypothetical protein
LLGQATRPYRRTPCRTIADAGVSNTIIILPRFGSILTFLLLLSIRLRKMNILNALKVREPFVYYNYFYPLEMLLFTLHCLTIFFWGYGIPARGT